MSHSLRKRGGRYSFRYRVPADLVTHYGRTEIQKALGTSDLTEAKGLAAQETATLLAEFDRLRKGRALLPVEFDALDREQLEDYAANIDFHEGRLSAQAFLIEQIHKGVEQALARYGIASPYTAPVQVAVTRVIEAGPAQLPAPGAASDGHLSALVEAWAKERKPSAQTVKDMERVIDAFYERVGRIPVRAITKAHAVKFKDTLLEAGNTPANTDKYLTNLRTLLNYAVANLRADFNAADGIKVRPRKAAKGARLPFDLPALAAIFSSPVYSAGYRPVGQDWDGEAAYWLPLLALYTGARIEELGQLAPSDVYEEAYFTDVGEKRTAWVMRLTTMAEGQELKNTASERRFPIHAEILSRGFVEFVAAQRRNPRVFHMPPDSRGREAANFGKWFGKYLRKDCAVANERMTFHSFRHTFKDTARARGIPKDVHDAITGHAGKDVADNTYGALVYPLAPLVEAMERYRIHGLDIPAR